jgi:NADPH-dependent 2,4-dienoyl-CoA reductase/sulfur reductase-like enzyme
MEKVVIIGGNSAGLAAASRAKRLRPSLDITVLEQSSYIAYSTCGLPYFISDLVPDEKELISFSPDALLRARGIKAKTNARALEIFPTRRRVAYIDRVTDETGHLDFDKLLIATGYSAVVPAIEGAGLANVFVLVDLEDGLRIKRALAENRPANAVIVGAGYVGLEMAEAFRARGLGVTLIEKESAVLGGIDSDVSELIEAELKRNGVRLILNAELRALDGGRSGRVSGVQYGYAGERLAADLVLLDVGIKPNVGLAAACGIRLGRTGAIEVNDHMETNFAGIYAAGNCAETKHIVSERNVLVALGTVAAKQGRVAGENIAGRKARFLGVVGTCVVKVFDLAIAFTGLTRRAAEQLGYKVITAKVTDHSITQYYPGGDPITIKIVIDRESRRLLGAQMVGKSDVAKRVDIIATVLANRMTIDDAAQLDLSYTPPYAPLWDPVLVAMNAGLRELER